MYTVPTDLSERDRSGNDCFGVVFVEFWTPRTEDATRAEYCVQDCSNTITHSTRVQYPGTVPALQSSRVSLNTLS